MRQLRLEDVEQLKIGQVLRFQAGNDSADVEVMGGEFNGSLFVKIKKVVSTGGDSTIEEGKAYLLPLDELYFIEDPTEFKIGDFVLYTRDTKIPGMKMNAIALIVTIRPPDQGTIDVQLLNCISQGEDTLLGVGAIQVAYPEELAKLVPSTEETVKAFLENRVMQEFLLVSKGEVPFIMKVKPLEMNGNVVSCQVGIIIENPDFLEFRGSIVCEVNDLYDIP